MRALAQLHQQFANPVDALDELKSAKNIAIVMVEAVLPRDGVREGERVDVSVSSIGSAQSLEGGRLLITPLVGPNPKDSRGVMAMASGPITLENPDVPTVGRVPAGATLERDWIHNYIANGSDLAVYRQRTNVRPLDWIRVDEPHITFVIDEPHAEWAVADSIAQAINEDMSINAISTGDTMNAIAMAFDPRSVIVRIPEAERNNPAPFIARLERLPLTVLFNEARVTINRKAGSIVITGNVEISHTIISYKGLSIQTLVPEPPVVEQVPQLEQRDFLKIDPQNKGGAQLTDLIDALSVLRVPAEDRITIIEQLHKTGRLHATLKVED